MFDVIIKNTILFLLIILISHFMINNILVDLNIDYSNKNKSKKQNMLKSVNGFGTKDDEITVNNKKQFIELPIAKPERLITSTSMDCTTNKDSKCNELYDYVYSKDAKKDLDDFFDIKNDIDKNNATDFEVKCGDNLCDNVNNYCNTSLPIKQELRKFTSNFRRLEPDTKNEKESNTCNPNNFEFLEGKNDDDDNIIDGIGPFESFNTNYDSCNL